MWQNIRVVQVKHRHMWQHCQYIKTGKLARGVLMLHDNACPHAAHATPDTLHCFGWAVLDHPPYRPDLSPCDCHVFGPLKMTLKGRRFNSDEAVHEAVQQWFIQQPMSLFAEGITKRAVLGQVPKQWSSVPVACLVLSSVCCHCGVVVVVIYILYTFLDPCLCFT
jgi:hypothetical protein